MKLWLISYRYTVKTAFDNRPVVRRETIARVAPEPVKGEQR